jgi:hypothetical protein
MLVGSRDEARRYFVEVRRKTTGGEALEPLERIVADIIGSHPEYHALLDDPRAALAFESPVGPDGGNPFLHLALHVALIEQLQTDRPPGILNLHRRLTAQRGGDVHHAEHCIMDCLAAALAAANSRRAAPDEAAYLACIRAHLR